MEQFHIAAQRHFDSATFLESAGHNDDAGYHYGVSAENAVKNAMREAGLESHWKMQGNAHFKNSPMRGHWAGLQNRIAGAQHEMSLFANGRRAAPLLQLAAMGSVARFSDWHIDIRYADPIYTPVTQAKLIQWKADALDFLTQFVF